MSRAPKLAFSLSTAKPDVPEDVSNRAKAPLTIHLGKPKPPTKQAARKPKQAKKAPAAPQVQVDAPDPIAEKKRAAAEAVRLKAAEAAREARAREEAAAKQAKEERTAREAAKAKRLERARQAADATRKPKQDAETVKAAAKARQAQKQVTPTPGVPGAMASARSLSTLALMVEYLTLP